MLVLSVGFTHGAPRILYTHTHTHPALLARWRHRFPIKGRKPMLSYWVGVGGEVKHCCGCRVVHIAGRDVHVEPRTHLSDSSHAVPWCCEPVDCGRIAQLSVASLSLGDVGLVVPCDTCDSYCPTTRVHVVANTTQHTSVPAHPTLS